MMEGTSLVNIMDRWIWSLQSSGDFTVASIRKLIDEFTLSKVSSSTRWIKAVPIKVNVLAWKIKLDNLPTRLNISHRGMDIDSILCLTCGKAVESIKHIFFTCQIARDILHLITRWWNIPYMEVSSYEEIQRLFIIAKWVMCHEPNSEGSGSAWKAYMNTRIAGLFLLVLLEYPNGKGVARATSRGLDMTPHWSEVGVAPLMSPRQDETKPGRFEAMAIEIEKNATSGSTVIDENRGRDDLRQNPKKRGTSKDVVASLDQRVAGVETSMAELKNQVEGLEGLNSDFTSMREDFRVALNTLSGDLKREIHDLRDSFMGEITKIREEFGDEVSTLHQVIEALQADMALCKRSLASGGGNTNHGPKIDVPKPSPFVGKREARGG
ncbi:putative retrotransposon gag domain, nucleotide-binding alpha-beta plait domain protein [Tanacetum coccineum]